MDVNSLHDIFIILHSSSATISFFAGGFLLLSSMHRTDQRFFSVYWWTLIGMVVLLVGAILVYWMEYSGVQRIIFPGLLALGIYMVYRAWNARHLLQSQPNAWRYDYIEHIGFTLISLFEGFIIVSGLNSDLPVWLVILIAVLGVLLGRWLIGVARRRVQQ